MKCRPSALVMLAVAATLPLARAQGPASAGSGDRPGAAAPSTAAEPPTRPARNVLPEADARLCLEFPTSLQVIMCAEKYRPRKRKA